MGPMVRDEAEKFADEGDRLGLQGKYEQAINAYDKALAIDPRLEEAWYGRGIVLRDLGRFREALDSFDKAVAISPGSNFAWIHRGTVLAALGRHPQAIRSYDRAIKICDIEEMAWYCRGASLVAVGRLQDAVENYENCEKALQRLPTHLQEEKNKTLYQLEQWLEARRPPELFVKLYKLVAPSEESLHLFIRQKLKRHFGEDETEWWAKGIPLSIRQKCAQRREDDPRRRRLYDYTDLIDLKDIIDKNWKLFEENFQQIKEQVGSKKEFLDGLDRLNEIRKLVMHPVRSAPTEDDHNFGHKMHQLIQKFANSG